MTLSRSRLFYIGAVLVSGIVIGLVLLQNPEWQQLAVNVRTTRLIDNELLDLSSIELEKGRADPAKAAAAASAQLSIGVA